MCRIMIIERHEVCMTPGISASGEKGTRNHVVIKNPNQLNDMKRILSTRP